MQCEPMWMLLKDIIFSYTSWQGNDYMLIKISLNVPRIESLWKGQKLTLICLGNDFDTYDGSMHHDHVIKWKTFPRDWPFVRGIHRWPVNSLHKGQWRGALMFSLIFTWKKVEQTIVRLMIWAAIELIMTSRPDISPDLISHFQWRHWVIKR